MRREFQSDETPKRRSVNIPVVSGCWRQVRLLLILFAVAFGASAACALLIPSAFQSVVNTLRNAGYQTYVLILETRGSEALKVITYEVEVTAVGSVQRDLGLLGLAFGEGATVEGKVRVALGADLKSKQFGILSCEVDTDSVRTTVGRAPLAGSAYDPEKIEQEAYQLFKGTAAKQAIDKYWGEARTRLQGQFTTWALGLEVPAAPTMTTCPLFVASEQP
ncbi:MAG: hypothetical protein KF726_27425 [Anaerolineae bacterium]|nr:hypothetical protein [Anaerolineae bacterium]